MSVFNYTIRAKVTITGSTRQERSECFAKQIRDLERLHRGRYLAPSWRYDPAIKAFDEQGTATVDVMIEVPV